MSGDKISRKILDIMYIQVYVPWQRFETRALSPRNFGYEGRKSFCDASM